MAPKFELRVVFLLLYILSLHAIAIFFFTRGFLLTRNELPLLSHCDDLLEDVGCNLPRHNMPDYNSSSCNTVSANSDFSDQSSVETMPCNALHTPGPSCWTPPAVKKVVILILDALRFDFVAPSGLYEDKPRPWMDKLQVMQKLLLEENSRAKLFKFIADPPTTSLQRLKGLTTGSLPTFIDVGNSFGAPAIVEDNIIYQLTSNGKKVIMMGDDTWIDLFPSQFYRTFPFPSFNVKDLHTVDDGVIENLFPALHEDDWDVLIGHFLGVDHVGHIFGVESPHMVEKLEQYNKVVEDVISILRDQSYQGGLHDDTLLLVMGDHGQTLNGDHGGGTAEEVETALFAWSSRQSAHPTSQTCHSLCITNPESSNQSCICEFQQLDFAATMAAILGIPFPFGSIGKVNPQLFGLVARMWLPSKYKVVNNNEENWLEVYNSVLCLNSWQVNRYFEQYSESVLNGFPMNDILTLQNVYDNARSTLQEWSVLSETPPSLDEAISLLADGVERYTKYLGSAAALARSKWTQFSDDSMAFGLVILLISLVVQMIAVYNLGTFGYVSSYVDLKNCRKLLPLQKMMKSGLTFGIFSAIASTVISVILSLLSGGSLFFSSRQFVMIILGGAVVGTTKSYLLKRNIYVAGNTNTENLEACLQIGHSLPDLKGALAIFFCCVYACSLLSNSFILREQHVVTFLLVSIGVLDLRVATQQKSKVPQALCFLVANFIMSSLTEFNLFKDTALETGETMPRTTRSSVTSVIWQLLLLCFTTYVPLAIVGCFFVMRMWKSCLLQRCRRVVVFGVPLSYAALFLHWSLDDLENLQLLSIPASTQEFARLQIPRMVYCVVALQSLLLLCAVKDTHTEKSNIQFKRVLEDAPVQCLGVWSGLILMLLGRQGPIIALVAGIEGWCILDKQSLYVPPQKSQTEKSIIEDYSVGTIQWSLFAVQIFFCTGHRCAFDGLRYAAAFIGFDEFNIYRQGALLSLDTFGASHILPAIGLALLVAKRIPPTRNNSANGFYKLQMSQAFLLFGLVRALTAMFTTICVTIQRRHLMVWGLFAPKFVFDAIGLLVTDVVLLITFFYYMLPFLI